MKPHAEGWNLAPVRWHPVSLVLVLIDVLLCELILIVCPACRRGR